MVFLGAGQRAAPVLGPSGLALRPVRSSPGEGKSFAPQNKFGLTLLVHCVQCSLWGITEVWGTTLLKVCNSTVCCIIYSTLYCCA